MHLSHFIVSSYNSCKTSYCYLKFDFTLFLSTRHLMSQCTSFIIQKNLGGHEPGVKLPDLQREGHTPFLIMEIFSFTLFLLIPCPHPSENVITFQL